MRKPLFLILAALVVVFAATRVRLQPHATANAADVKLLCVSAGGVYWVSQPQDGAATLFRASRLGRAATQIATAADIRSLAPAGRDLLYLTEDKAPNSGQLWRAGPGQPAPRSLLQGLRAPQGLLATRDHLYWVETRPSPAPGLACVPVLQPLSLIYRADPNGQARALLSVSESADTHFPGQLLGERAGKLYWLQHFGQQYNHPTMMVSRVPVQGGAAEQIVRANGSQDAVLATHMLYWTAPSEELSPALSGRTVRCVPLAGGTPRTLTDWMSADGRVCLAGQRPVYCDRTTIWRIPSRLGEAVPGPKRSLDPNCLTDYGGAIYTRTTAAKDSRFVRYPLTLMARLRGLFGP